MRAHHIFEPKSGWALIGPLCSLNSFKPTILGGQGAEVLGFMTGRDGQAKGGFGRVGAEGAEAAADLPARLRGHLVSARLTLGPLVLGVRTPRGLPGLQWSAL